MRSQCIDREKMLLTQHSSSSPGKEKNEKISLDAFYEFIFHANCSENREEEWILYEYLTRRNQNIWRNISIASTKMARKLNNPTRNFLIASVAEHQIVWTGSTFEHASMQTISFVAFSCRSIVLVPVNVRARVDVQHLKSFYLVLI